MGNGDVMPTEFLENRMRLWSSVNIEAGSYQAFI